jgi:hypothetical protein
MRVAGLIGGAWALCAVVAAAAGAQSALVQLGLTEMAARKLLLDEIKSPSLDRRSPLATAGARAFFKLPAPARAAAANGVFAWARAYVNTPAFKNAYAQHRRDVGADTRTSTLTVDEEVQRKIDSEVARLAELRRETASLPAEAAAKMLDSLKAAEENLRSPAMAGAFRQEIEAARGNQREQTADLTLRLPLDPEVVFARRLREFLDATADVNFSARMRSLDGGPDGIVFLDRADRTRHWIWQLAVIAGPDATSAARAAAQAWLQEIAP